MLPRPAMSASGVTKRRGPEGPHLDAPIPREDARCRGGSPSPYLAAVDTRMPHVFEIAERILGAQAPASWNRLRTGSAPTNRRHDSFGPADAVWFLVRMEEDGVAARS